ncbi:hypothetical protein [Streptomyces sp. ISL-11]|uniref:hypothetical protein n=1 Tax=Streptomyces sp. ISL-11 TaxID=2819174 RepID=UPI0020360294|nr:hypothetical protein [Streptomyces sp. ISL-11]
MGDQDDSAAEKWDACTAGHEAILQFDVGDTAFVDAGVVAGGDSLGDGVPVFAQGSCEAGEKRQFAVGEVGQLVGQGSCVTVVEHGGESADQVVGAPEFWSVVEEPGKAVVDVRVAAVRVGDDPPCGFAW